MNLFMINYNPWIEGGGGSCRGYISYDATLEGNGLVYL